MQSPDLNSAPAPELNISINHSHSEERSEVASGVNLDQLVTELKGTPINIFENIKDLEKTHAM